MELSRNPCTFLGIVRFWRIILRETCGFKATLAQIDQGGHRQNKDLFKKQMYIQRILAIIGMTKKLNKRR